MTCAQNIGEKVDIEGYEYLVHDDSWLFDNSNNLGAKNDFNINQDFAN
jgi:hypothetical protein